MPDARTPGVDMTQPKKPDGNWFVRFVGSDKISERYPLDWKYDDRLGNWVGKTGQIVNLPAMLIRATIIYRGGTEIATQIRDTPLMHGGQAEIGFAFALPRERWSL